MSATTDLIRAIVDRIVGERIDYLALYPARVVSQGTDGTLDVQPDDSRLPPMQAVPIRYGVPGVRAEVPPGAKVLIGFEGGSPAKPIATLWELTTCTLSFNGGTRSVARRDDGVDGGTLKIGKLSNSIVEAQPLLSTIQNTTTFFKYEPADESKPAVAFLLLTTIRALPDGVPADVLLNDGAIDTTVSMPLSGLILDSGIDVKA